jgi:hypothetical protein
MDWIGLAWLGRSSDDDDDDDDHISNNKQTLDWVTGWLLQPYGTHTLPFPCLVPYHGMFQHKCAKCQCNYCDIGITIHYLVVVSAAVIYYWDDQTRPDPASFRPGTTSTYAGVRLDLLLLLHQNNAFGRIELATQFRQLFMCHGVGAEKGLLRITKLFRVPVRKKR